MVIPPLAKPTGGSVWRPSDNGAGIAWLSVCVMLVGGEGTAKTVAFSEGGECGVVSVPSVMVGGDAVAVVVIEVWAACSALGSMSAACSDVGAPAPAAVADAEDEVVLTGGHVNSQSLRTFSARNFFTAAFCLILSLLSKSGSP